MKQRATRNQMKIRVEKEQYQNRYDFWSKINFMFRLESFKTMQELEKDNEIKSIDYQVLKDLTS